MKLTDAQYMIEALVNMLGPNGLEVYKIWKDGGVLRFHCSWGPEAVNMTGEERAGVLLDMLKAPKTEIHDVGVYLDNLVTSAPMSSQPKVDVRDLIKQLNTDIG